MCVKQLAAIGDQAGQVFLKLPHFAIGTAAIFGRVEQYAVITSFAPNFARDEFGGILDNPADRALAHARQSGIVARLRHRFFGGIDMHHLRARR